MQQVWKRRPSWSGRGADSLLVLWFFQNRRSRITSESSSTSRRLRPLLSPALLRGHVTGGVLSPSALTEAAGTSAALTRSPVSQEVTRFKKSIRHPSWTIWTSQSGNVLMFQLKLLEVPDLVVPDLDVLEYSF